jgi:hypothetical protein
MKPLNKILTAIASLLFLLSYSEARCQDKGTVNLSISYHLTNNLIPYVQIKAKTKTNGKFRAVGAIPVKLQLGSDSSGPVIANLITNEKGEASSNLSPSLQAEWNKAKKHSFVAYFPGNKEFEAANADLSVARAKIILDTTADKKIVATVLELKDSTWTPVKGVDVQIAVKRFDADLSVNEKTSFTTDSLGQAGADFKRDSIPGDKAGNIILIAKVEDNDQYGNLSIETKVPWGSKFTEINTFNRRTLFATRDKAPIWLLLIASSIIVTVWGILVVLVLNIFRIKKLGKESALA